MHVNAPDAPHRGGRSLPGHPPATPAPRTAQQGMPAKGPVPGPHACTPASTVCGQRAPTACSKDRRLREGDHLTPDAPHEGTRRPPRGSPPATRTACNDSAQESALWGRCWALIPHLPRPPDTGPGPQLPAPRTDSWDEAESVTPDAPHINGRSPPRLPPATPAARNAQHGVAAKGLVPGPHTCTPAPTVCGQRAPNAGHKDGQPGEGERLTPDAPREGAGRPPGGSPPASPRACNASLREGALWGRCWVYIPTPATRTRRVALGGRAPNPRCLSPRREGPPGAPYWHPQRHALLGRECQPKGQCQVPTPAHLHPKQVGIWPGLPAPGTGSRGRLSA